MKSQDKKVAELSVSELKEILNQREAEEAAKKYAEEAEKRKNPVLETAFMEALKEARDTLYTKVDEIQALIEEAEALSEKLGIPFRLKNANEVYTPNSFFKKFKGIDWDVVADNSDVYPEQYPGWYSSSSNC